MAKHTRKLPWCDITVDSTSGTILVLQKWKYTWLLDTATTADTPDAWTDDEKITFHTNASDAINTAWSTKATFNAAGTSDFAKANAGKDFTLKFEVRHVTAAAHWDVSVTKTKKDKFLTSSILWNSRKITLDTNDMSSTLKYISPDRATKIYQIPIAHEFGHTIGNVSSKKRGDEYRDSSAHKADTQSIMHSGNRLRNRHFKTIDEALDKVIPDTSFSLKAVS